MMSDGPNRPVSLFEVLGGEGAVNVLPRKLAAHSIIRFQHWSTSSHGRYSSCCKQIEDKEDKEKDISTY